jgi:phospholipase/lecithinase/hemolysin
MPKHLFTRLALSAAASAVLALSAAPAGATTYSAVYAFGDSLSDTSNLFNATGGASPQAFDAVKGGYLDGRFSNGKVAVEVMAQTLGVALFDFAYGGAMTTLDPTYPSPLGGTFSTGLQAQVALHDQVTGNHADGSGLYFIWAGSNDLRDAFGALGNPALTSVQKQAALASASTTVITNLANTVGHLYAEGARNFLLPTLPDFGLTPEGHSAQLLLDAAGVPFSLSAFSSSVDTSLTSTFNALLLPGASLTVFDTLTIQRDVFNHPGSYGVGDVSTPCFSGYVNVDGTVCAAGLNTTNMFWDKVHPSALTHSILGAQMAAVVPEPASLLLMALGVVGLLGWSRRQAA